MFANLTPLQTEIGFALTRATREIHGQSESSSERSKPVDPYYDPMDLEKFAEMTEAVHVVTAIRGGASLVHGLQMRKLAKKLSF